MGHRIFIPEKGRHIPRHTHGYEYDVALFELITVHLMNSTPRITADDDNCGKTRNSQDKVFIF